MNIETTISESGLAFITVTKRGQKEIVAWQTPENDVNFALDTACWNFDRNYISLTARELKAINSAIYNFSPAN